MSKEKAAACTNKQKKLLEKEKQTSTNTVDADKEQASISELSQSTSSEVGQTSKEEDKPSEEEQGKNVEEKREEEKMEVDPCSETAGSSDEKGKC